MKQDGKAYEMLRKGVEQVVGLGEIKTTTQFAILSGHILSRTHVLVSVTTLKRFWGVIEQSEVRKGIRLYILDALAQLCGYVDFESFCSDEALENDPTLPSAFCTGEQLSTEHLPKKSLIMLQWSPNRQVTVRYEGMGVFRVLQNANSKMQVDATFHCHTFTQGEPLVVSCLINPGKDPVNYICGKRKGGISFKVLSQNEVQV